MRLLPALWLLASCTAMPHGVKLVEAPAGTTDVAALVRDTQAQARAEHRRLVVYVGAHWCEPCQVIHAAASDGKLDGAFPDLELLVFDLDRDHDALDRAGYGSTYIPLFVLPGPDGRAGARRAEGGLKHGDNLQYLSEKLATLLGP
jgi:thiol:disulfide interchange protein